jgi:hypothetical protein
VAASRRDKAPDPLGKRALFWVPSVGEAPRQGPDAPQTTVTLPVGKRALFSGARPRHDSLVATSGNPLAERGIFTVECERCGQTAHVGVLDLLIYQLPVGFWLPRGRFDRRMTCPSCRVRAWCSVSLRHS